MASILIVLYVAFLLYAGETEAVECRTQEGLCGCIYSDGRGTINFQPISGRNGNPSLMANTKSNEIGIVYFDPCQVFSMGPSGSPCKDVLGCAMVPTGEDDPNYMWDDRYVLLAKNGTAQYHVEQNGLVTASYVANNSSLLVQLICNWTADYPVIEPFEHPHNTSELVIRLESRCSCPGGCVTNTGSKEGPRKSERDTITAVDEATNPITSVSNTAPSITSTGTSTSTTSTGTSTSTTSTGTSTSTTSTGTSATTTSIGTTVKQQSTTSAPPTSTPPKPQQSKGLSTGSVLVILFLIVAIVYLLEGVIYNALCRGARGVELIPNLKFWMELPALVADGCRFVLQKCRRINYERI